MDLLSKWGPYVLIALAVTAGLLLIKSGSEILGGFMVWLGNLLGFGSEAVIRKVKERAKIKADKIASGGPDAITADINVHLNKLG